MNPNSPTPAPELIEAAAAAWLSLRDRGMNATETAAFVRWLQEDSQHAAVFSDLDQTWRELNRLSVVPVPAPETSEPDADLLAPRVRPVPRHVTTWSTLGAVAAVLALVFTVTHFRTPRTMIATAVGGLQTLDLTDGSIAQLNTDSAISVAYTATERRVRVLRGEVHFTVSRDPDRAFLVTAGPVVVRAIGTAFNVRQREDTVEVLVTEGRVQIDEADRAATRRATPETDAHPLVVAGERARIAVAAPRLLERPLIVEKVTAPEYKRALAWQERRLEFDATPLSEVAAEFNRYMRRQLVIADPVLAGRRFSGTFRADGYEALVRLLENDFGVQAIRSKHEIRLHISR